MAGYTSLHLNITNERNANSNTSHTQELFVNLRQFFSTAENGPTAATTSKRHSPKKLLERLYSSIWLDSNRLTLLCRSYHPSYLSLKDAKMWKNSMHESTALLPGSMVRRNLGTRMLIQLNTGGVFLRLSNGSAASVNRCLIEHGSHSSVSCEENENKKYFR